MEEPLLPQGDPIEEQSLGQFDNEPEVKKEQDEELEPSDSDHCRICRGERTIEEPLFYPCKCNGSIRYVHQACLMQWLSHSQKKHCELCKTPFRFTKLYDPHMPTTVPWPIFIQQASKHSAQFILKCARWSFVLFVWLAWVPWCMRGIWRILFWIGDGSWISQQQLTRHLLALNSSTTASAVSRHNSSSSALASLKSNIGNSGSVSQNLNMSSSEPLILQAGRMILNTIIFPYTALANTSIEVRFVEGPPRTPSVLSNVGFLKTPTKFRIINEILIDILEGQLITIGILITFILVFLIREWVVQQQPIINLGAAAAAAVEGQGVVLRPIPPAPAVEVGEEIADANLDDEESPAEDDHSAEPQSLVIDTAAASATRRDAGASETEEILPELAEDDPLQYLVSPWPPEIPRDSTTQSQVDPVNTDNIDDHLTSRTAHEEDRTQSSTTGPLRIASPTRPEMPDKEIAARAPAIARALQEHTLGRNDISTAGASDDLSSADSSETSAVADSLSDWDAPDWEWTPLQDGIDNRRPSAAEEWHTDDASGSEAPSIVIDNEDRDTPADDRQYLVMAGPGADLAPLPDIAAGVENLHLDPEVVQAAAEAGIPPEEAEAGAIEDGEDLDGVLELIGVQGPIANLLQNGMFSTVIISMTVLFGIWLPYLIGKVVLIVLAHPVALLVRMPLKWISVMADLIIDSFIFFSGCAYYWLDQFVRLTASPLAWLLPFVKSAKLDQKISQTAHRLTWSAADRLTKNLAISGGLGLFSDSDIPVFSILAHASLRRIELVFSDNINRLFSGVKEAFHAPSPLLFLLSQILRVVRTAISSLGEVPSWVGITRSTKPPQSAEKPSEIDVQAALEWLKLAQWSASDRIIAVLLGYAFVASLGFFYLKIRKLIKEIQEAERPPDGLLVDVLNQAGGVSKVILIITIEMLVFPLYCGFLLDTALLPLFGNATLASRMAFLSNSPWTSVFIHWFAGTCYMFHFALFVAMCRKILRTGVLYFIRDPDDPSFHPVRDVLERNITTQLRKILFSALVYGGLVIVCLGAVVWGISSMSKNIFPIHWSSNEPVLEFPADLLVYNFLMPLAVKVFKPSAGLQDMYNWWFRKCARLLRLSHFLFNERNADEEGYTVWKKVGEDEEIEEAEAREGYKWPVIRDGRLSWQTRSSKCTTAPLKQSPGRQKTAEADPPAGYKKAFVHDGRLVRAPASDQVRIPKGNKTFVDIDPVTKIRKDGQPDIPKGLHGTENKMFSDIYVPPWFRVRIASFIALIWAFAAVTGVLFTIIPLLFGRYVFSRLIQSGPRMNDVYAFAIGFYLLAGPAWILMRYRAQIEQAVDRIKDNAMPSMDNIKANLPKLFNFSLQSLRVLYFYTAFGVVLPSLLGLIWETYILIPLHTYFQRTDNIIPQHTVHFVSDWTLGVLFMRVAVHVILKYPTSQLCQSLKAMVSPENNRSSWLDPDIKLATKSFIAPLAAGLTAILLLPFGLGRLLIKTMFDELDQGPQTIIYRYSYPIFLAITAAIVFLRALRRSINKWRVRVRDEVYLIGERLHNFNDRKGKPVT